MVFLENSVNDNFKDFLGTQNHLKRSIDNLKLFFSKILIYFREDNQRWEATFFLLLIIILKLT